MFLDLSTYKQLITFSFVNEQIGKHWSRSITFFKNQCWHHHSWELRQPIKSDTIGKLFCWVQEPRRDKCLYLEFVHGLLIVNYWSGYTYHVVTWVSISVMKNEGQWPHWGTSLKTRQLLPSWQPHPHWTEVCSCSAPSCTDWQVLVHYSFFSLQMFESWCFLGLDAWVQVTWMDVIQRNNLSQSVCCGSGRVLFLLSPDQFGFWSGFTGELLLHQKPQCPAGPGLLPGEHPLVSGCAWWSHQAHWQSQSGLNQALPSEPSAPQSGCKSPGPLAALWAHRSLWSRTQTGKSPSAGAEWKLSSWLSCTQVSGCWWNRVSLSLGRSQDWDPRPSPAPSSGLLLHCCSGPVPGWSADALAHGHHWGSPP